jgi:predicted Abi (CAAX) family protease
MFFLGTVSAVKEDSGNFDGSATPDLALIDAEYRDVVWIDAKHPSQWDELVYDQLNEAWRADEGISHYFEKTTKDMEVHQTTLDSLKTIPKVDANQEQIDKLQRQIDSLKNLEN